MMNNNNFFENNLFIFNSFSCEMVEDIIHSEPDMTVSKTLKLKQDLSRPLVFAFANNRKGLVKIGDRGQIIEENLLGKLISIQENDSQSLIDFSANHGCLFPIRPNEYKPIDTPTIFQVITRIKSTIELLNHISNLTDCWQMLSLIMYLLYTPQVNIPDFGFSTHKHSFKTELERIDRSQDINRDQELFETGTFTVVDTLSGTYEVNGNLYKNIMNSYSSVEGHDNEDFKDIVYFYANKPNANQAHRKIVDLLFHYQLTYGVLRNYRNYDKMEHYSNRSLELTTELKQRIVEVAKIVVGEEINANINGIHPEYDIKTMSPKWTVDSLISALYFSIFYLNPDLELYRKCANPNCQQYFIVKSTATKKKYCSMECSNAVQQANYRRRQKNLK